MCTDLFHELLKAMGEFSSSLLLQGGGKENPPRGDEERLERETNRIWAAIGEHLGVGPPPARIPAPTPDPLSSALNELKASGGGE